MKRIEVIGIDFKTNLRLAKALAEAFKDADLPVRLTSQEDSLLSQAIKISRTYPSLPINKQASFYLDAAREAENQVEFVKGIPEDTFNINAGSFYIYGLSSALGSEGLDRVMVKRVVKRMGIKPNVVFLATRDQRKFMEERRKLNRKGMKIETSYAGFAAKVRNRKYLTILERLVRSNGTVFHIIDSEGRHETDLVKEMVGFLIDNKIIGNTNAEDNRS